MCVVIITARLGSKRLKRKNIKNFFGKPVISYPIQTCLKTKFIKRVFVSTESKLIANISKKYSAEVPFLRPKRLADDVTNTLSLMKYLVKKMKFSKNQIICCIYPITPLLNSKILINAFEEFKNSKCDFLMPVIKANKKDKNKFQLNKQNIVTKKSNTKSFFKDPGQFYFGKARSFNNNSSIIFSGKTIGLKIKNNQAMDINTSHDWKKLKKMYKKKYSII